MISNQEFQGITCQVAANPVFQEGKVTGAVILILDVTEKMKGEQMRREFTANVSHELEDPSDFYFRICRDHQRWLRKTGGYQEICRTYL